VVCRSGAQQQAYLSLVDWNVVGWWFSAANEPGDVQSWQTLLGKTLLGKSSFAPMVTATRNSSTGSIVSAYSFNESWVRDTISRGEPPVVLGYDEPYTPGPTSLSAQEAAASWGAVDAEIKRLEGLTQPRTPFKIASPTISPEPIGMAWAAEFFRSNASFPFRFDYVSVHAYTCDAEVLRDQLSEIRFVWNKPIILTGWGCAGNSTKPTADQSIEYMRQALGMLEVHPWVVRHCWTGMVCPWDGKACALASEATGNLTPTGIEYMRYTTVNSSALNPTWKDLRSASLAPTLAPSTAPPSTALPNMAPPSTARGRPSVGAGNTTVQAVRREDMAVYWATCVTIVLAVTTGVAAYLFVYMGRIEHQRRTHSIHLNQKVAAQALAKHGSGRPHGSLGVC
jgi:hypothetical protein